MEYLILKWIHILSSTILFGTGIGSAFYFFMANRKRDIAGIAFATRTVVIADWIFTTPAALIQLLTGLRLAQVLGHPLTEGWVMMGLILYCAVGACWIPVVWMQTKMRDMAEAALALNTALPARYWRMNSWWVGLGSLAFPLMAVIFYLMVFKPNISML